MAKEYCILITGAAGFIGWKVCELLLTQPELIPNDLFNHQTIKPANQLTIVGIDNLNDYYDVRLKKWRLRQLMRLNSCSNSGRFVFEKVDIENYQSLRRLFLKQAEAPFYAVINLAARAGVRYSLENPFVYYRTNIIGNLNLLELCREFGVQKYILASSSSLYAGQKMPFKETLPVNEPISPYAASKKAAELTCFTYHKLYKIDTTVLRYFTVYGPGSRPDMSPLRFISWLAQGKPVTIYGDGNQSRDFTYVDDIARGTILGLKRLGFETINLGSDRPYRLIDFLHIIESQLNRRIRLTKPIKRRARTRPQIIYEPAHAADLPATWADITKAKKILNWQPATKLKQGLENSVNWFLENSSWTTKIRL